MAERLRGRPYARIAALQPTGWDLAGLALLAPAVFVPVYGSAVLIFLGLAAALVVVVACTVQPARITRQSLRWQCVDADGAPVEPTGVARLSNMQALVLNAAGLLAVIAVALLVLR